MKRPPSIGIIDIGNLSVDELTSNNVLGVCTKYGGHRSDFSFTRHEEKNNPVMVTLTGEGSTGGVGLKGGNRGLVGCKRNCQ